MCGNSHYSDLWGFPCAQEAKSRESRDHKRVVKQRTLELLDASSASGLTEDVAAETAEAEWVQGEATLESALLERDLDKLDFSTEKRAEKERLLSEGFSQWTRRDHKSFVSACERYARENRAAVITEVKETTDKPEEEVQRYYDIFWLKGPELLPEWKKIEEKLSRAHSQLSKRSTIQRIVHDLISKESAAKADPFKTITVPYHSASKPPPVKGFTEEEGESAEGSYRHPLTNPFKHT